MLGSSAACNFDYGSAASNAINNVSSVSGEDVSQLLDDAWTAYGYGEQLGLPETPRWADPFMNLTIQTVSNGGKNYTFWQKAALDADKVGGGAVSQIAGGAGAAAGVIAAGGPADAPGAVFLGFVGYAVGTNLANNVVNQSNENYVYPMIDSWH
jgi:hypothetical protein